MNARRRKGWLVLGIVAWIGAPLILITCLSWVAANLSISGGARPAWVRADSAGNEVTRQVQIAVTWSDPAPVVAPGWSGTVSEVDIANGSTVASGDVVLRIDAIARIAFHSRQPFYRDLRQNDSGDDVTALNELLASRALPNDPGPRFTRNTLKGVSQLGAGLGAGRSQTVFASSWIVYLPADKLTVGKVTTIVGAPAPGAGSPLFMTAPMAASGRLLSTDTLGGDDGASTAVRPDEVLSFGGKRISVNEDGRTLSSEGLDVLSGLSDSDQKTVAGTLTRHLPDGAVRVPAAAVHTDAAGNDCVAVRVGGNVQHVVQVSVLGGSDGQTLISGLVEPGDSIGVNALSPKSRCR